MLNNMGYALSQAASEVAGASEPPSGGEIPSGSEAGKQVKSNQILGNVDFYVRDNFIFY
ncbi:uncharacterized protein ACLA_089030 [Aspergillus clavatus NRRL 1]|uniref:Uncharacterized protein n=1 Tax=Aspergillus clavatus (strain ATCC 1007 / CBS 513.65 / DSM 816 / NCTC 3887 / NRRL 1 / QM 1276 / 107) TaxID=344612 RepID=A1CEB3_ASPCL|nr:uncharacterized protein ACLA_089030 [Aspergillus clavatus NRRL 1]EAW11212.1 hypothetical protein ACLA_089030 [Aspergillus clavatus NRRL 1]